MTDYNDLFSEPPRKKAVQKARNVPEFSVTELSFELKRTVEGAFSHVRVRGEISGFKRAASGHLYMALKDADSVIDGICWRGAASKLSIQPEDGLEVIVTGKLTTYPGRSKYQIVIETMELAGEGALLKLLEARKKQFAAEGLFDEARKKTIPYLPQVIGIVTSPTGAVIKDILHRLKDRFPRHVLLWPVMVQGQGAAEQIAAAIRGFNSAPAKYGDIPKPDLLIVARGGGSLEDLWAFNEEVVVRATAESDIPVISAVGHETDTTLIDYVSDRRAPTPTGAAEMAVPVRADLLVTLRDLDRRMISAQNRRLDHAGQHLTALSRGLPKPENLLNVAIQRLDDLSGLLETGLKSSLQKHQLTFEHMSSRLRHPQQIIDLKDEKLKTLTGRLERATHIMLASQQDKFVNSRLEQRLKDAFHRDVKDKEKILEQFSIRLENLSHQRILERGFALIRDEDGYLIHSTTAITQDQSISIELADGKLEASVQEVHGKGSAEASGTISQTPAQTTLETLETIARKVSKSASTKKVTKKAVKKVAGKKKAASEVTEDDRQESLF